MPHDILTALAADPAPPAPFLWAILLIAGIVMLINLFVIARFFTLWLQAFMARANVTMWEIIGMRLRKVDDRMVVNARIVAAQAGLDLSVAQLESHYLVGGHVPEVVRAMIAARLAGIDLPWNLACAMDIAGKDVLHAVQKAIDSRAAKVTFL
jgi:uncharacterized protein YqfA (UPF0365 family)